MLEIACFEITSAETALRSVADRIEFCADLSLGGTTPNIDEFRYLKSIFRTPIYVMTRPTGGEFLYTDAEFREMQHSIISFKNAGADGFVFGILDDHSSVDIDRNLLLLELAGDVPCTFHRAIDRTRDIFKATETIIELGFSCILTSGGAKSAVEGKENLKVLVENYSGDIDILIGGGVRSGNIAMLKDFTGGMHFHSSAIRSYEQFASEEEIKKLKLALN